MAPQINRSAAYLSRNKHSYCFRLKVPDDLRCYVGKKELRYSLKTGYLGKAKSKARRLAGMVQQLFQELREGKSGSMELSDQEIQKLVLQHLKKIKADYDKPAPFGPFELPPLESDRELSGLIDSLGERGLTGELKAEMASGDYSKVIGEARSLLAEILPSGDAIDEGSMGFKRLCEGLMRAEIMGIGYYRSRLAGKYGDDLQYAMDQALPPEDKFKQPHIPLEIQNSTQPQLGVPTQELSISFAQVVSNFWDDRSGGWKPRTKTDYQKCKEHLIEGLGADTPVHTIKYPEMKAYRQKLIDRGLSTARVNFYVGFASSVFNYEMRTTGHLNINPAGALKLKETRRRDEMRDGFSLEQLEALFVKAPEYGEDKLKSPDRFWIPLLALFSGARLEEICQLHVDQVREIEGVWSLVVEETHKGQSVNTSERRVIPLHPFLNDELGFHRYVQKLPAKGRLWPNLKRYNDRYGHYFGRWFGWYWRSTGITGKLGFHSFRHTVETELREADVEGLWINMLTGHSIAGEGGGRYTKRKIETILEKAVMKLRWNEKLDLSHLKKSRFVIK